MVHAAQFVNIRICVFSRVLGLVGGNDTRYSRLMVFTSYLMENESPLECRVQKRLEDKLRAAFEEDPLEDGMHHPAEKIIADALSFQLSRDTVSRTGVDSCSFTGIAICVSVRSHYQ